jgi:hypothetical protein
MQIFKNSEVWEVIVSRVRTETPESISRLRKNDGIWLNEYHFWKLHICMEIERWCMQINLMREQHL